MGNIQTTSDIDAQIAKLEEKLNNLLDKIQEAQSISVESNQIQTIEKSTQNSSGKSRKEILVEYEKEYLARLEAQQLAETEIQRARDETEYKKNSTRGAMPKGFRN